MVYGGSTHTHTQKKYIYTYIFIEEKKIKH